MRSNALVLFSHNYSYRLSARDPVFLGDKMLNLGLTFKFNAKFMRKLILLNAF
jgi:hypothetical protein